MPKASPAMSCRGMNPPGLTTPGPNHPPAAPGRSWGPWPTSPAARARGMCCTGSWSGSTTRPSPPATPAPWRPPPPCCRRNWAAAAWKAAGPNRCCRACSNWCTPPWGERWGPAAWGISAPAAGSTSSTSTCPWRCPPTVWCAAAAWRRCSATTPAAVSAPPMASSCASWRWPAAASSPAPSTWCSATASAGGWPTGRATGWGAAMARARCWPAAPTTTPREPWKP